MGAALPPARELMVCLRDVAQQDARSISLKARVVCEGCQLCADNR